MPFSFYFSYLNWQSSWGLLLLPPLLLLLLVAEHPLPFPGLDHELIPLFEDTYSVFITVKPDPDDIVLCLQGMRMERAFVLVLILSLACKFRMKRNRGK